MDDLTNSKRKQQCSLEVAFIRDCCGSRFADTRVSQTRSDLDKTVAELKSVQGDMGVQSGLIATNAKELAAFTRARRA
jgi:hypothetical protein